MFLTGIGRSAIDFALPQGVTTCTRRLLRCPVVMFFPGLYNERELILCSMRLKMITGPGIPTGEVMDGGNCYADQGHV